MVKDGYKFAAAPLLFGVVALGFHWNWLGGLLLVLGAFVLFFFRDPERTPPPDPDVIVSPADGRVMEIVEEARGDNPGRRISVFLSIFDVHVNRAPVAGRIAAMEYRKGRFNAAMRVRASEENEQNVIHVSSERGEIVFKQIAGWVARRILCWKAVGDSVTRGERVGMIRFGSRVDIWLPDRVEILVHPGEHVAGIERPSPVAMSNFEQHELGFPGSRAANLRLRRGIYLLPSLLTVANMVCGFYAVMSTLKGELSDLDNAAKAIGFAFVFDSLDGLVARATGTSSEFGKQFDSLADMVSFGIAPAVLAFTWGVRGILQSDLVDIRRIHEIGWWVGLAFAICCAWRLARFNIQGMAPGGGSRYFVGLPCPAAAGLLAAYVHALKPIVDWRWSIVWMGVVLSAAGLMASPVRFRSFKDIPWARRQPSVLIVPIAVLVPLIFFLSEVTLTLIATCYVAIGLALHVLRIFRKHSVSHPA